MMGSPPMTKTKTSESALSSSLVVKEAKIRVLCLPYRRKKEKSIYFLFSPELGSKPIQLSNVSAM